MRKKEEEEIPDKFLLFFEKNEKIFPEKEIYLQIDDYYGHQRFLLFHSSIGHLLFISFQFFSLKTNRIFTEKKKIRKINVIKKEEKKSCSSNRTEQQKE